MEGARPASLSRDRRLIGRVYLMEAVWERRRWRMAGEREHRRGARCVKLLFSFTFVRVRTR